jgi:uncharacterized membrane protein YbhN (UPF0104 family)
VAGPRRRDRDGLVTKPTSPAALLVFRLLYLILPLLFSLVVVVVFERERIGELVRARGGG